MHELVAVVESPFSLWWVVAKEREGKEEMNEKRAILWEGAFCVVADLSDRKLGPASKQ